MKIGFFTDSYLPSIDGVATSVEASAKELQRLGHSVFIIAPDQPHGKDRKNIYRLISFKFMETPEVYLPLEIPQLSLFKIAALDFDIIHGHSGGLVSFLGWQIALLRNIPFIETYHTLWRHYKHYFPYPKLLKIWMIKKITEISGNDCDAVIAPSEKAKKDLLSDGVKKPIYVVPNGINVKKFSHQEKGFLYNKFNIPKTKKILLTIGRLDKEKSIDFIIKSCAEVFKSFPETLLVIIGEGREKERLHKLAGSLNISKNIYFAGLMPYDDIPKAYADASLFIFSSQTETQGMVIAESLASGLPVVAVVDDAFQNVIIDGFNGYMERKDINAFAGKIKKLLHDYELLAKFKHNAVKTSDQFSVNNTAKMLEKIYVEVIENKNKNKDKLLRKIFFLFSNYRIKTALRKLQPV